MLKNLNVNQAQSEAISHGKGAMLVLAGPGSGKTLVITQRIKYLIEEHKVLPQDILVITFTKAAAQEMQERFMKLTQGNYYPVNFGTFHAIFFQILRHTYRFTADNIIREADKYKLLSQIMREMPEELRSQDNAVSEDELKDNVDDSTETIQGLLSEISAVKNNGLPIEEYKSNILNKQEFEYVYTTYKKVMNQRKLVDFDDMILLCRDLLVSRPDTLKVWQDRFKYILIDEFQDINPLQYEIVKLLSKPEDNLFIVGDDDQSIYGFRGAKPDIMLHFKDDYPQAKQILLNVNYRSKKDIVDTACKLISNNKDRFAKEIEANNPATDGVKIYTFASKQEQTKNMVELIKQYVSLPGAKYSDIAILYRTNSHTAYTAQALIKENIPFTLKEKPKNIYESSIAKDIIAYLRYATNENEVKDFYRIMNKPVRYIKRNTVPTKCFSMNDLLRNNVNYDYVIQNIIQMYEEFSFLKKLNPFSAVNFIRKGIKYEEFLEKNGVNKEKYIKELDDIQESARDFSTIEEWLYYIENYDSFIDAKLKNDKAMTGNDDNCVNIVTMHASKGLEWKVVLIPDVNENVVPHKKAVKDEEIEEERRMFYVALTRAKENLFVFCVHEKEAGGFLPSRFINEILDRKYP